MAVSKKARAALESSKAMLKAARKYAKIPSVKGLALEHYINAATWAAIAELGTPRKEKMFRATANQLWGEAHKEALKLCGLKPNPSKSTAAAIGGGAGALLLGPIGAIAGGYLGATEGKTIAKKAKKAGRKVKKALSNPKNRSANLRKMMQGT